MRGKGKIISDTTTAGGASTGDAFTGDDVLDWLRTDDARRQARRLAARRGLDGYDAMSDNVLADARVSVWNRLQSDEPLEVDKPAAYGTTVIRSVLRQLAQGRDGPVDLVDDPSAIDLVADPATTSPGWAPSTADLFADTSADDARVVLEGLADGRAWVTSAALTYLTLLADPTARSEDAPWPRAGATPEQARCWPGLWFAGVRDVFDDGDDARARARIRRTRARRIEVVLDRVQRTLAAYRLELESDHG